MLKGNFWIEHTDAYRSRGYEKPPALKKHHEVQRWMLTVRTHFLDWLQKLVLDLGLRAQGFGLALYQCFGIKFSRVWALLLAHVVSQLRVGVHSQQKSLFE